MDAFELGYKYGTMENDAISPRRAEMWLRANKFPDTEANVMLFCCGHDDGVKRDGWRLALRKESARGTHRTRHVA